MARSSVVVEKSERTLFKELGIKKRPFLESLREQEKVYLLFNSYHRGLASVERCDQALFHLREMKFHLQEVKKLGCRVAGDIGRLIQGAGRATQEALGRVSEQRNRLDAERTHRKRLRSKDYVPCRAAVRLHDLLEGRGKRQIGYYGALALYYLDLDSARPKCTAKHNDCAVNRFWTRYNTGKRLPECEMKGQKPGRNDVSPHIVWEDGDP